MMALAGGVVTLSLIAFAVFMAVFVLAVFPLWMLADCAKSRAIPVFLKALWAVSIFMAWPFGSLAYASFASQKRSLMKISNLIVVMLIVVTLIFSAGVYYFRSQFLPQAVAQYQKMDLKEIPQDKEEIIKSNLLVLQNEMQANSFFSEKSLIALQLFELFQSIMMNPKDLSAELDNWSKQFAQRDSVRDEELRNYVSSLNRETIRHLLPAGK